MSTGAPLPRFCSLLVTGGVASLGILNLLSAVLPAHGERTARLTAWLPWVLLSASRSVSVVAGVSLLLVARGLWRRKRHAWVLALALTPLPLLLHLPKGPDMGEAGCALGLLALLVGMRHYSVASSDPQSVRRGYGALIAATVLLVVSLVLGRQGGQVSWFILLPRQIGAWLSDALVVYGLLALLRPSAAAGRPGPAVRRLVTDAVATYGQSAISPYALDNDKAIFVGPSHSGVVAYGVTAGVAVVAGDPLGPGHRRALLLDAFLLHCRQHGWVPAFYQILPERDNVALYRKHGFALLTVGEDAMIDLARFTLVGRKMATVRHSVAHCERAGLSMRVDATGALDHTTLDALEVISTTWLASRTGAEMSFSFGSFSRTALRESLVAIACDSRGHPLAFATFRPCGGNGVALDLLRHVPRAPSGTMDYLLARTLEHLKERGIVVVSLGFAPLANTRDGRHGWLGHGGSTGMEWVFHTITGVGHCRSLYVFKQKFNPHWEPRYLAYPDTMALPGVLYALVRLHLPYAIMVLPPMAPVSGSMANSVTSQTEWPVMDDREAKS